MPAKASFQNSRTSNDTKDADKHATSLDLKGLIRPLVAPDRPSESFGIRNSELISLLFSIGTRCSVLSSPRERLAQMPWLEHLFISLVETLGFSFSSTSSGNPPVPAYTALDDILKILADRKVSIHQDLLDVLIVTYSGLSHGTDSPPHWSLIASIIKMDAGVFFGKAPAQGTTSGDSALHRLATHISSAAWTASRLHKRSHVMRDHPADYGMIKYDIVLPLMETSSAFGATERLIWIWYDQLSSSVVARQMELRYEQSRDGYLISLWEDADLILALQATFENTFTADQIETLLNRLATLAFGRERSQGVSNNQSNSAAVYILDAIFCCIKEIENMKHVMGPIKEIIHGCARFLLVSHLHPDYRSKMWRLSSKSLQIWCRVSDPAYNQEFITTAGDHQSTKIATQIALVHETLFRIATIQPTWGHLHEAMEALAWLGNVLTQANQRNSSRPWKHIPADFLNMLTTALSSKEPHVDEWSRYCLFSTIVEYPAILLTPANLNGKDLHKHRHDLLRAMLAEARRSQRLQSSQSNAVAVCWRDLMVHMLQSEDSLLRLQSSFVQPQTICSDLIDVLLENEDTIVHKDLNTQQDITFNQNMYLHIPPELFSRQQRDMILDHLMEEIESLGENDNGFIWQRRLSLMVHFLHEPCNSSRIVSPLESSS